MKLGPLRSEELPSALVLSAGEGWNQTAADWRRMIGLEPAGCFAAREGDRLVGTVTTTTYGDALAGIGMMVVHPDFRRQGIGAALMRLALNHLRERGIATVKLDATPAGRPLYESLGFVGEVEMERWQGVVVAGCGADPMCPDRESLRDPFELDRAAYGVDRSRLLERLVAEGVGEPLVAGSERGDASGYALARPGRAATYIGPVIGDDSRSIGRLAEGMLARFAGQEVCLDRHRGGHLEPELLAQRGLTLRRSLCRMYHGARLDAGTARSIGASAGPEFG